MNQTHIGLLHLNILFVIILLSSNKIITVGQMHYYTERKTNSHHLFFFVGILSKNIPNEMCEPCKK